MSMKCDLHKIPKNILNIAKKILIINIQESIPGYYNKDEKNVCMLTTLHIRIPEEIHLDFSDRKSLEKVFDIYDKDKIWRGMINKETKNRVKRRCERYKKAYQFLATQLLIKFYNEHKEFINITGSNYLSSPIIYSSVNKSNIKRVEEIITKNL